MLSKEQLLEKRIKALVPDITDKFKTGDIFDVVQDGARIVSQRTGLSIDWLKWWKYPEIFREMYWWEERTKKELPEYVAIEQSYEPDPIILHVDGKKVFWTYLKGEIFGIGYWDGGGTLIGYIEPATEEEYNTFIQNKSK